MKGMFRGQKQNNPPQEETATTEESLKQDAATSKKEAHPSSEEKMMEVNDAQYKKLIDEVAEYKDKYVRLFAEFENVRKRMEREKVEFIKYANEGLLADFLNILDDLERSVEAARAKHQDYDAFMKGIELVMAHVYELLKKNDVKPVESVGKKFDPFYHEVLMQEETDQHEDRVILEEFQKGYCLGDRVIRTAKVKVARKKEQK